MNTKWSVITALMNLIKTESLSEMSSINEQQGWRHTSWIIDDALWYNTS